MLITLNNHQPRRLACSGQLRLQLLDGLAGGEGSVERSVYHRRHLTLLVAGRLRHRLANGHPPFGGEFRSQRAQVDAALRLCRLERVLLFGWEGWSEKGRAEREVWG